MICFDLAKDVSNGDCSGLALQMLEKATKSDGWLLETSRQISAAQQKHPNTIISYCKTITPLL